MTRYKNVEYYDIQNTADRIVSLLYLSLQYVVLAQIKFEHHIKDLLLKIEFNKSLQYVARFPMESKTEIDKTTYNIRTVTKKDSNPWPCHFFVYYPIFKCCNSFECNFIYFWNVNETHTKGLMYTFYHILGL